MINYQIGIQSKYLMLNGAIVILSGLICGLLLWLAIIHNKDYKFIHARRVAHATLAMDGVMMIVVGLIIPFLNLSEPAVWILTWSLVIAGYGFVLGLGIDALKGYRSLAPKPYGIKTVLFGGHAIGVAGSLIGIAIVIYGLFNTF
ncbi:MAG: hypothetical protein AB1610_08840 [Nitrospirota bacterium]